MIWVVNCMRFCYSKKMLFHETGQKFPQKNRVTSSDKFNYKYMQLICTSSRFKICGNP